MKLSLDLHAGASQRRIIGLHISIFILGQAFFLEIKEIITQEIKNGKA